MIERLPRHQRNLALAAVALLVLWFAWSIRAVLNPLVLGYALAAIVVPIVRALTRRGWKRRNAVVAVFSGAILATLVLAVGVVVQLRFLVRDLLPVAPTAAESVEEGATQAEGAVEEGAALAAQEQRPINDLLRRADAWMVETLGVDLLPSDTLREELARFLRTDQEVLQAGGRVARGLWSGLQGVLDAIFGFSTLVLLVPLYAFFWMFEMDAMHDWVRRHLPVRERERTARMGRRMGEILSRFFRGRLTICFLKGLLVTVFLALAGVPYSLLLGILAGTLSLVPFVGSVVAFALGALVAAAAYETWWVGLVVAAAVYGVAELLEGYVLVPRILGESLGLSEVAVLFAVTAGGAALGLFGVLAALPLAAAIKVLFEEYVDPALTQWADEPGGA